MTVNAYFENVLVYNVDKSLDVVTGTAFSLELSEEAVDVFANQDKVLDIDQLGGWINLKALSEGTSVVRIMNGEAIVKDLIIKVVSTIARPATTLNLTLGEPVQK